jgi:hypothetical protein
MKLRVFRDVLPCSYLVDIQFRTRQYIPEDSDLRFVALVNKSVSGSWFSYSKLHTLVSMVTYLPVLLYLRNG